MTRKRHEKKKNIINSFDIYIVNIIIKGIGDNYGGNIDRFFSITKANVTASISPVSIKVGEKAQITAVCGEGAVSYESKKFLVLQKRL